MTDTFGLGMQEGRSALRLNFVIGYKSFATIPTSEDLPNFVVITGANGSGKTQFLEALNAGAFHGDWEPGAYASVMLTSAQLGNPVLELGQVEPRRSVVERFEAYVGQFLRPNGTMRSTNPEGVYENITVGLGLSEAVVRAAEAHANKPITEWGHSDFELWTPFEIGHTLFGMAVSEAFSRYQSMLTANDFRAWRASQGKHVDPWLTSEQFEDAYGPAPWDLLNDVLVSIGLPYAFIPPPLDLDGAPFVVRLRALTDDVELGPSELSAGEKTLLQLALSIYSGTHRVGLARTPKVLLLDEPDATLHPSMVRSMLSLIQDVLVSRLDIRVIMTTHSPTTVALSPEGSLFIMERAGEVRLTRASRDGALRRLLVGVPTLSVSAENRRVILVESPNDARWYTSIYAILRAPLNSDRSLEFVAAGGPSLPDGCDAVVGLVEKLRANGNLAVWGLVDRDRRQVEPDAWVHFNASGYSIENIVLDPLSIGLLLLADNEAEVSSTVAGSRFVNFDRADAQTLADTVMRRVLVNEEREQRRAVAYREGLELDHALSWFDIRGHDLHDRILTAFPNLNRYAARDRLIDHVVSRVWVQYPGFIPQSIETTMRRLLDS